MDELLLPVPDRLSEDQVLPFEQTLQAHLSHPCVQLDFRKLSWSCPFGMLLLAAQIDSFVNRRKQDELYTGAFYEKRDGTVCSYLAHLGFFHHIGLPYGKDPGEAPGSNTYMPITVIERQNLERQSTAEKLLLSEVIEKESARLAGLIAQNAHFEFTSALTYCFREVIRNVFEHSCADRCVVCAQRWSGRRIEIAIVDQGRGIRKSLGEKYDLRDDWSYLQHAIKPGITRTSGDAPGPWGNTGYGLYALSELCRLTGSFVLSSGECSLKIDLGEEEPVEHGFGGTAIKLEMTKPSVPFNQLLAQVIERGEKAAGESGSVRKASKSSRQV